MTSQILLPVVILYREDYHDSNVYQSLLHKYDHLHIVIYENSPTPDNRKYASEYIHYFHNPNNGGVTAGYNRGAAFGAEELDVGYILLLDQDTRFEEDYLEKLSSEIERSAYDLYVPVIMTEDGQPCSPVRVTKTSIKGVRVTPGVYSLSEYKPINSGACVRLTTFLSVGGYNEHIKLDFADFDFFERLATKVSDYKIIDSVAYQSFSNEEKDNRKLYNRFRIYIQDALQFQDARRLWPVVLRHTLALTLRTKKLQYISYFISKYLFKK